jgi:RNA polymerase sigma-70 factor (ECF subfamily)
MEQKTLVRAARQGDGAAFTQLYGAVYQDMYRFAYYMLRHPEDAKDAVSDTFLAAWENIRSLKKDEAFRSWIFAILSNKCRRKLREYANRREVDERELEDLPAGDPLTSPEHMQLRELFLALPEIDRLVIGLHVFAGYTTKEIAHVLHMNENTVRSREHRALKRLGEELEA